MCTLKKYSEHDPNTIEAVQFTGENGDEIINLLNVSGGFQNFQAKKLHKLF